MRRERMSSAVSMLKLFYAPHKCALASHFALEEAGAVYEAVRVDFKKMRAARRSTSRSIPRAVCHRSPLTSGSLAETPAILAFIAQSYTKARLAPLEDWFAFAQV